MPAASETLRIATFAAPLSRDGPGLLLRDLLKGDDPQIVATVAEITLAGPDVLILTDFDYDLDGLAMAAFDQALGGVYPYRFARQPNAGMATGLDIDRDGRTGDARDAQGYGQFAGDGGLAILSRHPIDESAVRDLSGLLWSDLPNGVLPQVDGGPFFPQDVTDVLRLSSTAHWIVPLSLANGQPLHILAYSATPPVFDGPEDMNGLRARDELRLWENVLDGMLGAPPASFVIAGNANLDPLGGQGDRAAMAAFLSRPDVQDPHPSQPNADWGADGPGQLRVSYVLPSTDWRIIDAGVVTPPAQASDGDGLPIAGPHRLVWVQITR